MKFRNWGLALAGLCAVGTPLSALSTVHAATSQYVETNHGWVAYHSGPALKAPILGRLHLGDKASLLKKYNAYWYEVQVGGKDVYITTNKNYTKVVTNSSAANTAASSSVGTISTSTTPASSQNSNTTYVETKSGWVKYFNGPSLSSSSLGKLQLGDRAKLISKYNHYWYKIQFNGKTAYITTSTKYVRLVSGQVAAIPGVSTGRASTSSNSSLTWKTKADKVVAKAETQLNVPYLWGKQLPGIGFDCSNFTEWAFHSALGLTFSTSSQVQRDSVGTPVSLSNIREGDLLFFKTANNSTGGGHVGIYLGNGKVIQEGGGWKKVTIEPLSTTWLGRNLVFARRIIQ